MEPPDEQDTSGHRAPNLPVTSRSFTTQELEAVIRRAVELQAGSSARSEDGLSEAEIVRIGQELGLEPATVRRAMAEVRGRPAEERGALVRIAGAGTVRAARVLRRPAASTGLLLDRYLRESEFMVAQRRFPDRTRYVRDASLAAGLARFARGFSRSHKPLDLKQLDVAVSALDTESCLLEFSVDLAGTRGGLVAGVFGGGSTIAAGWVAVVWASAIVDPLMLLGIPVVAGSWFGMRAIYGTVRTSVQEKLESLLDRVEHNDLTS
ncbi:MAG TPA: hypothetical protein VFZ69_06190 [Longimicrobiales bacterium]